MAPFAFLALLLAAVNPDLPIGRNTPPAIPAPASAPAPVAPAVSPIADTASEVSLAPSDDYGYVAFCYGAESGYLALYDRVMPEVERIERTFPGATPIDQALAEYPRLRGESQAHINAYAAALTATERASPQAIAPRGLQVIGQGRSTWDGAGTATLAQSARAWMGWAPPEDCTDRAAALADRARLQSAVLQNGSGQGGASQSSVELDRLANSPALAAAPGLTPMPAPPAALALRGSASAPTVATPSPAPRPAEGLGVSFAAPAAAASNSAGLGVSFDGSAAPLPASPAASPAIPAGLPLLAAPPITPPASDPPPWRGIL